MSQTLSSGIKIFDGNDYAKREAFNENFTKTDEKLTTNASANVSGMMSKDDKSKLDAIAAGATKVEVSTTPGNVKINGAETTITPTVTTSANGLMSKDDKTKLDGVAVGATKSAFSTTNGNIKINGTDIVVYTHPSTHPANIITGLATVATSGSFTDLSDKPNQLPFIDSKSTNHAPFDYKGLSMHIKNQATDSLPDTGSTHGILHLTQWADSTGGAAHQLALTNDGNMYMRTSTSNTTWGSWKKVFFTTGDTITGQVKNTSDVNVDGSNFRVETATKDSSLYAYEVVRNGSTVGGFRTDGTVIGSGFIKNVLSGNYSLPNSSAIASGAQYAFAIPLGQYIKYGWVTLVNSYGSAKIDFTNQSGMFTCSQQTNTMKAIVADSTNTYMPGSVNYSLPLTYPSGSMTLMDCYVSGTTLYIVVENHTGNNNTTALGFSGKWAGVY